jgi:hypothetical protein
MKKTLSEVTNKSIEGENNVKSNTVNPIATDEILNLDFYVIMVGWKLRFSGASKGALKEISSVLGEGASYDVASGFVTYNMREPKKVLLERFQDINDFLNAMGASLALGEEGMQYESAILLTDIPDDYGYVPEQESELID